MRSCRERPTPRIARQALAGLGVSDGTAAGPVALVAPPVGVDEGEPACTDPGADGQRVRAVLEAVVESLRARAAAVSAGPRRDVLEATAALATDKALLTGVDKQLRTGAGATRAVHAAVEVYAAKLRTLGGAMAERATDLYDIRDRAVARLRGLSEPGVPALDRPSILVAADLAPAETATLDPARVLGIVTEAGGATSHTAILAAQLGIPAVVQAKGILGVAPGSFVAIDGTSGDVIITPSDTDTAALAERSRRRAAALAGSTGSAKHNHRVALLANIGTVADAAAASGLDLEGCGLLRTEFLFVDRESAPTVTEQAEMYAGVLRRSGAAAWWCAPWTPAPTSRCASPTSARSPTPPLAAAGCASPWRARTCSTPSSSPSPRRARRSTAATCGSWPLWWPRRRRPSGLCAAPAPSACPRSA